MAFCFLKGEQSEIIVVAMLLLGFIFQTVYDIKFQVISLSMSEH